MALSNAELELVKELDDPIIEGVIKSMDDAIDTLHDVIAELSNKVDKLENRLDNV